MKKSVTMSAPVVFEGVLEAEYSKKNGVSSADVARLRSWLATQPHLPKAYITDLDLALTYHCCQHSVEVSKQVLDLNLTLRTLFSNLFKDRVADEKLCKNVDVILPLCLEKRSHDDYWVFYVRLMDTNPKKFVFQDACRTVLMVLDLVQAQEGTWPGALVLLDLEGFALGHITRLDLPTLQQFLYYVQEAMLWKLKGIHIMNAPSFVDKLLGLIRPFVKKEFFDLFNIHLGGAKDVEKYLPIEALPKDIGGQFKSFDEAKKDIKEWLKANQEYFAWENHRRVEEKKRPGRPKTISDIFGGVEGSFKKLDID